VTPPMPTQAASAQAVLEAHLDSIAKRSATFKPGKVEVNGDLAISDCTDVTSERVTVHLVIGARLTGGGAVIATVTSPDDLYAEQREEMYRIIKSLEPRSAP
jgi:hypothetical protein